jgi:hypothetical protein
VIGTLKRVRVLRDVGLHFCAYGPLQIRHIDFAFCPARRTDDRMVLEQNSGERRPLVMAFGASEFNGNRLDVFSHGLPPRLS